VATAHGISSINLLPKKSFEFSTFGKVLKWATSAGRVLVVLTEFVVLMAFATRFYFDKKLSDIGEESVQKETQIAAYADVETQIRKVLAKQSPVEAFQKNGLGFSSKVASLTRILPVGTVLESMTLDKSGLILVGRAQSEFGFAQFVSGIKKIQGVSTINMRDTSFDQTTGGVKFSIQIGYK
jgi:hypothetical protein